MANIIYNTYKYTVQIYKFEGFTSANSKINTIRMKNSIYFSDEENDHKN